MAPEILNVDMALAAKVQNFDADGGLQARVGWQLGVSFYELRSDLGVRAQLQGCTIPINAN